MDRGEAYHRQMSGEKISRLIIKLGIPTTITMLITNIYNLVDTYFVGTLGTSQQGATGILFTLQAIIQAFAFLLGHGAGTHVSRKLANKDVDGASRYVSTSFFLGLGVGTLLLAFGLIFLEPFMRALGSSDTILPYAKEYGLWVLVTAPFMIGALIINNILRYEGKAFYAMIGLVTGALLNILGDYIFITVMGLGVFGAGMSTGISQIVSFIILFIFFFGKAQTKIGFKRFALERGIYADIFVSGLPSFIRQGLASIGGGVLNNVAKPMGDAAIAAISVVNRYSNFIMCVGLGVGQGFQPVAAYNYSSGDYSRVRKGCLFTWGFTTVVIAILSTVTLIIPEQIIAVFNSDPEVIALGKTALIYAAISLFFMPISVIANLTFQAVRKSWTSTFLSLLRNGAVFIPVIFILVYGMGLGFQGVALAQPVSDALTAAISLPFLIVFLLQLRKMEKEPVSDGE